MAKLLNNPFVRFFTFSGTLASLNGGKLYTYEAGTTTPKATYTDADEGTPHANPIVLDSTGVPANGGSKASIWLATGAYKLVLKDSSDNTIQTIDNVTTTGNDENITIENSDPSLTITDTDGTLSHVMGVTTDTIYMKETEGNFKYMEASETVATFGYDSGETVIRGPAGITISGPVSFSGSTAGLRYGSMYINDTPSTIDIAVVNTWYQIYPLAIGMASSGMAVSGSDLTAPVGVYKLDYSLSCKSVSGTPLFDFGIFVNEVYQNQITGALGFASAYDKCIAGCGFIDITDAAHTIELRCRNLTDASNLVINDCNVSIVQVAGT